MLFKKEEARKDYEDNMVPVTSIADVVNFSNRNTVYILNEIESLKKENKKTKSSLKFVTICSVLEGLIFLKFMKKQSDSTDRLKEQHNALKDDYYNYVINRQEYNPDKDDILD